MSATSLDDLVTMGDRATERRDPEALADAVRQLAMMLGSSFRHELVAVEALAAHDIVAAGQRWTTLARSLRDWIASRFVHRG